MSRTVAFHTLGCKLNFAESGTLARQLAAAGFSKTSFDECADVYIINTCSVTEQADKECRLLVRKAVRNNPDAYVAVVGCYAQLKPRDIASIPGVNLVLGANEKFNIAHYISQGINSGETKVHSCEIESVNHFVSSSTGDNRTRSFLKVQDGCDYPCTYCTIPLARGKSRSDTIENVLHHSRALGESGIREIVLTGVNLGDFGNKNEYRSENFLQLIETLDQVETIDRFRISSIEPNLLTDEIIRFVLQSNRFVPHFHIPLQSGSNRILGLMKRRYNTELYRNRVETIKRLAPQACIGADVIVGFPGESESDFMETFSYLTALDISYLHVFTYSERENTPASDMPGKVAMKIRKERNKRLQILSHKKMGIHYMNHSGQSRKVLFESENTDGFLYGYTDNYIRVKTMFSSDLVNTVCHVTLHNISEDMALACSVDAALEA